jgi:hypothetical protein
LAIKWLGFKRRKRELLPEDKMDIPKKGSFGTNLPQLEKKSSMLMNCSKPFVSPER